MSDTLRPTKKQRELLTFIESFILANGYSPSYREIMAGCNYNSVATVALHVNNLIKRGHLLKRDHSARSLEVLHGEPAAVTTNLIKPSQEKWLVEKVDYYFKAVENEVQIDPSKIDELYVLIGALKILGLDGAAQAYISRLSAIKHKAGEER